jgi:endonuclease/exonuclease/phosphatase family metal-dependent hydrolase
LRRSYFFAILPLFLALLASPSVWLQATRKPALLTPSAPGPEPRVAVVSLNLAAATDTAQIVSELRDRKLVAFTDVYLFQEVVRAAEGEPSVAEQVAKKLGMNVVFSSPDGGSTTRGLAIVSRFPVHDSEVTCLKDCDLLFRSRKRISVATTVRTPAGDIRVFNAHLDTRINPPERLEQLQPVIQDAARFSGPSIIGGDFNTNDMRWLWNVVPVPRPGRQAEEVMKAMRIRGFSTPFAGTGATFDSLGMRLDWIYTRNLSAGRAAVQPLDFSDHHAIWTELSPQKL